MHSTGAVNGFLAVGSDGLDDAFYLRSSSNKQSALETSFWVHSNRIMSVQVLDAVSGNCIN